MYFSKNVDASYNTQNTKNGSALTMVCIRGWHEIFILVCVR